MKCSQPFPLMPVHFFLFFFEWNVMWQQWSALPVHFRSWNSSANVSFLRSMEQSSNDTWSVHFLLLPSSFYSNSVKLFVSFCAFPLNLKLQKIWNCEYKENVKFKVLKSQRWDATLGDWQRRLLQSRDGNTFVASTGRTIAFSRGSGSQGLDVAGATRGPTASHHSSKAERVILKLWCTLIPWNQPVSLQWHVS